MSDRALVVGVSGIVGNNLADLLVAKNVEVYGLARRPGVANKAVRPVAADVLDAAGLKTAVAGIRPTHVFFSTWVRNATEAENCKVNSALVRNLLNAVEPDGLKHVALVTGLKHYLGPFDAYAAGKVQTPFREEMPRLPGENFYYDQEDEVFAAAERLGFSWSVHRPHTVIGFALGNAMNMGVTLAVYASICRETAKPFLFPGSPQQWGGISDVTDARLLARHLWWASTSEAGRNQAFNVANGDVFRWNWLWPKLAAFFGLKAAEYPGHATPLETQMADCGDVWSAIAKRQNLIEIDIKRLASAWHTDLDLGRPMEVMTDMTKSRLAGFTDYQSTPDSFYDLFRKLRELRVIP